MIPLAALAVLDPGIIAAAVAGMLGGGLVGAAAAWRKAGPEADQIVSETLIEVNEHLRQELTLRDTEIDKLRGCLCKLRTDLDALEVKLRELSVQGALDSE